MSRRQLKRLKNANLRLSGNSGKHLFHNHGVAVSRFASQNFLNNLQCLFSSAVGGVCRGQIEHQSGIAGSNGYRAAEVNYRILPGFSGHRNNTHAVQGAAVAGRLFQAKLVIFLRLDNIAPALKVIAIIIKHVRLAGTFRQRLREQLVRLLEIVDA